MFVAPRAGYDADVAQFCISDSGTDVFWWQYCIRGDCDCDLCTATGHSSDQSGHIPNPVTYSEVSSSFGGTGLQTLRKVKFPMAVPSIMLGLNQAVMMALAMQVVTPLIGGGGLGREVFHALNIANTGKGLAAGIGIVLLAIILDRLSQAWTKAQRKALGI